MSEYPLAHHQPSEMLAGQAYDMRSVCPFSPELGINKNCAMYDGSICKTTLLSFPGKERDLLTLAHGPRQEVFSEHQ
jgi:hypothetical protein